jgi:hypothetical protein
LIETEDISKKLPRPYFPSALDCRRVYATLAMDKCSRPGERRFSYTTVTVDEDVLALGIEGSVYLPQLCGTAPQILGARNRARGRKMAPQYASKLSLCHTLNSHD